MASTSTPELALAPKILQTINSLGSTIKSIRHLSASAPGSGNTYGRRSPLTLTPTSPSPQDEFHQFWMKLELIVRQTKDTFESLCETCDDLAELEEIMNLERMGDEFRKELPSELWLCEKIQSSFVTLFDKISKLEKLCSTESVTFQDETEDIFEQEQESYVLFRSRIRSLMKQVKDRLDNLLKSPLKPNVIPTYVKSVGASHSYSSSPSLTDLSDRFGQVKTETSDGGSSSDYSDFDLPETHKGRISTPTEAFRLKKLETQASAPTPTRRPLFSIPNRKVQKHFLSDSPCRPGPSREAKGRTQKKVKKVKKVRKSNDSELVTAFRKATTDFSGCTLTPDCNCFHCYPLHLPEVTPPGSSYATDDEDSDIDTFAVLFDLKPFSNNRSSSRYFGGRDLFEGIRDDDEPEVVKDKLKRMREQEIIWNFEKVLADAGENTFSSMIEKLVIRTYHCFIGFWQKLRIRTLRRYRKVTPYTNTEIYESTKMV